MLIKSMLIKSMLIKEVSKLHKKGGALPFFFLQCSFIKRLRISFSLINGLVVLVFCTPAQVWYISGTALVTNIIFSQIKSHPIVSNTCRRIFTLLSPFAGKNTMYPLGGGTTPPQNLSPIKIHKNRK